MFKADVTHAYLKDMFLNNIAVTALITWVV